MRIPLILTAAAAAVVGYSIALVQPMAHGHCQVPCGIYDDPARITLLREDAKTIRKAITSMQDIMQGDETPTAFNQATRWVMTKDETATNVQRVVSDYFLTQRVKAVPVGEAGHDAYLDQLAKMHAILVAAMKCKQTVELSNVDTLDAAIEAIAPLYVPDHTHDD